MWIDLGWILGLWIYGVVACAVVTAVMWLFGKEWPDNRNDFHDF